MRRLSAHQAGRAFRGGRRAEDVGGPVGWAGLSRQVGSDGVSGVTVQAVAGVLWRSQISQLSECLRHRFLGSLSATGFGRGRASGLGVVLELPVAVSAEFHGDFVPVPSRASAHQPLEVGLGAWPTMERPWAIASCIPPRLPPAVVRMWAGNGRIDL
jgi:hypothetical protein